MTLPTARAMASGSFSRPFSTLDLILASCASVACSSSSRFRARSSATRGFLHTTSLSPGRYGAHISANSFSSKSVSWINPCSWRRWIAFARRAVIQSYPASWSSSMRVWVIMPRSPTTTTRLTLNLSFNLSIWLVTGYISSHNIDLQARDYVVRRPSLS